MNKWKAMIAVTVLVMSEMAFADPVRIVVENIFGNPAAGTHLLIQCAGLSPVSGITNKLGQFDLNVPPGTQCQVHGRGEQGDGSLEFTNPRGGCVVRLDLSV